MNPGNRKTWLSVALAAGACAMVGSVLAADEAAQEAELAKKLQNPVADLISAPVQNNWDFGIGPADAMRYTANVQPIIPISLSKDWLVVTRTILPSIYAQSPVRRGSDHWGLGGADVRATLVQPFVSYTTKTHTTLGLTSESTYDWEAAQWSVPVDLTLTQLLNVGHLPVQFGLGPRIYAEGPKGGRDWGFRFTATPLLPN